MGLSDLPQPISRKAAIQKEERPPETAEPQLTRYLPSGCRMCSKPAAFIAWFSPVSRSHRSGNQGIEMGKAPLIIKPDHA